MCIITTDQRGQNGQSCYMSCVYIQMPLNVKGRFINLIPAPEKNTKKGKILSKAAGSMIFKLHYITFCTPYRGVRFKIQHELRSISGFIAISFRRLIQIL